MPSFHSRRVVKHKAPNMFALVADIERYPDFVPLCEALAICRRSPGDEGIETLIADMKVGYKAIHETFVSRVTLDPVQMKIKAEYIDGPFSHLENRWTFQPHPDGCEITFFITYEFRNLALKLLMGAMFDRAFRKFVAAFERRADEIYDKSRG